MIITQDGNKYYVTRETGEARAATESHFWFKFRNAMNTANPGADWKRVTPHKMALTSMPYALQKGPRRKRNDWIIDNNYMLRQAHETFNNREPVELLKHAAEFE
jgi:hypothetical protein